MNGVFMSSCVFCKEDNKPYVHYDGWFHLKCYEENDFRNSLYPPDPCPRCLSRYDPLDVIVFKFDSWHQRSPWVCMPCWIRKGGEVFKSGYTVLAEMT